MQRPKSVTVISYILIVLAALALISGVASGSYERFAFALLGGGGNALQLTSGVAMLGGRSWGRLLYFLVQPASVVLSFVMFRPSLAQLFNPSVLVALAIYLVCCYFLTRRPAAAFFRGETAVGNEAAGTL